MRWTGDAGDGEGGRGRGRGNEHTYRAIRGVCPGEVPTSVAKVEGEEGMLLLLGVEGLRIQRCEGELDDVDGDLMLEGAEVWGVGCGGGR